MTATTLGNGVRPRVTQRLFRTRPEDALPHVATHHRVYIVPTRRGFAFLLVLVLMLVASVNYALSLGYALSFILTGLFAASLLHTYQNLAGLEVRGIESTPGFAGDTVAFHFTLYNTASTPRQGICVQSAHGDAPLVAIAPQHTTTATLTVAAEQRGRLPLGRLTLQSHWPLGLWTCWCYLHVPVTATVYPKPETDPPPLPSRQSDDLGGRPQSSLDGEIAGVREYRQGDPLNAIAWKSVAKGAGLQVRTFENPQSPATATLSLQATGLPELEDQLSRLSAWAVQAHAQHTAFALDLPGKSLDPGRGDAHVQQALQSLALYGTRP